MNEEELKKETLIERIDIERPDVSDGIIRNVHILGFKSKNNREYEQTALAEAVPLYENAPVYVDHDPDKPRKAEDRFGILKNVRLAEDGIRGDLIYLTTHPMAQRITEDLQKNLRMFGLSHHADGLVNNGKVKKILTVHSVDLVSGAATTQGLLEQYMHKLDEKDAQIKKLQEQISNLEKTVHQLKLMQKPVSTPGYVTLSNAEDRKRIVAMIMGD